MLNASDEHVTYHKILIILETVRSLFHSPGHHSKHFRTLNHYHFQKQLQHLIGHSGDPLYYPLLVPLHEKDNLSKQSKQPVLSVVAIIFFPSVVQRIQTISWMCRVSISPKDDNEVYRCILLCTVLAQCGRSAQSIFFTFTIGLS